MSWYTGPVASRTHTKHTYPVCLSRPDMPKAKPESRKYRNPVIYAQELYDEMVLGNLTRKQLAERHGITSNRVTQWLCLLKLPEEIQQRVIAHGDNWNKRVIT